MWERKPTTGERNRTYYALLAYEQSFAGLGTLTAYNAFKWVADAIAEDLVQWIQLRPVLGRPSNSPGSMIAIRDPLGMRDALVNKLWVGAEHRGRDGFQSANKLLLSSCSSGEKMPLTAMADACNAMRGAWG